MSGSAGAATSGRPDLGAALSEAARRWPDRPAIVTRESTISYAALEDRVAEAAGGLAELGVSSGDRVALLLGNSLAFVEAFIATLRTGAAVVPINTFLTSEEAAVLLEHSRSRVIVVAAGLVDNVPERPDTLEHVVVAGGPPVDGSPAWEEVRGRAVDVERTGGEVAAIVYTSGTTGRPKGATLTRDNLATNQDQVLATPLGVRQDDVVYCVLPLFHIYAMNVALGCSIRAGATLVLEESFHPESSLENIERHQATIILGAPPMYIAWLATEAAAKADLANVRVAVSGAAPLPAAVLERFRDELGITIWEGYGLTETSPALTTTAMGGEARPGTVGLPLPGVELRLVDEAGRDVTVGDPGEVWVRGANVFAGYLDDEEATRDVLTGDGWFRTGDVGILDEDGYLRLVDRLRDLVIVSGFNVYPREVEEVLHRHPDISAAAVVGVPHPYSGEAVMAYVVARPGSGLRPDDVRSWAAERLARFKCPDEIRLVDELPYTATGKVKRRLLRNGEARP